MDTETAERILIFFISLYWLFFSCTLLRVLLTLYDVCYRKVTKWTHAKTIHATIAAALLSRAIHLTLLHFDDEGHYLFISPVNEDMLFKLLGSVPAHILISVYSLLGLLWLSVLAKTYDVSSALIPKTFTLFGKIYDSATTKILKQHLTVFCISFNLFLYCSWIIFFVCMWYFPDHDKIFSIEVIFTTTTAVMLAVIYYICWNRISCYQQNGAILSVEKHRLVKRILFLVVLCTIVFAIKLPLVIFINLTTSASWLTSFSFDLVTFTVLEIIPFLFILFLTGGKKVEELRNESSQFSFSFRKYSA